jgi:two-component system cell cycle sensor histidine kinase PleC
MRSKLREGTEVIVTFPAERVMTALPPVQDDVPIQPSISEGVTDITKEGWRRRAAAV